MLIFSLQKNSEDETPFTDSGKLYSSRVSEVRYESRVEDLQSIVKRANDEGLKVSIAGSRHSQGGHTFYEDAIVLDMSDFDEVLEINDEEKILRVESGATWDEIQMAINPKGLSVKTMQSSNVFTVGGSMGSNIHGRDLEKTQIVETIKSFRLLL